MLLVFALTAETSADPFVEWSELPRWTGFGETYGISIGDIDGDGWMDVLVPQAMETDRITVVSSTA